VQRTGWTRDVDRFLQWLTILHFSGGGFGDACTAEGLSDAIFVHSFLFITLSDNLQIVLVKFQDKFYLVLIKNYLF
jgi:Mediator complex subunit 25 von Willebrand factor type A